MEQTQEESSIWSENDPPSLVGQLWDGVDTHSKGLVIFLVIVLTLLVSSTLLAQGIYDYQDSHFADVKLIDGKVNVIFPTSVRFDPPNKLGRPLIVEVADSSRIQSNPLTVTIGNSQSLEFTDAQGQVITHETELVLGSSSQTTELLYVRPVPVDELSPAPVELTVDFPGRSVSSDNTIRIERENKIDATVRLFFLQVASNLSLLFAWVTAFTALVTFGREYLKQREERRDQDHDKQIQTARDVLQKEPVHGIELVLRLAEKAGVVKYRDSPKPDLESWATRKEEIETLCTQVATTRELQEQLLRAADDAFRSQDKSRAEQILKNVQCLLSMGKSPLSSQVAALHSGLFESEKLKSDEEKMKVFDATLSLWQEFDEDIHDLTVGIVLWAYKSVNATKTESGSPFKTDKQFRSRIGKEKNDKNNLRLLRDPGVKAEGIESDLASYNYRWSQRDVTPIEDHSAVGEWLEKIVELPRTTFGSEFAEADKWLLSSWGEPKEWSTLKSNKPSVISIENQSDATIMATKLREEILSDDDMSRDSLHRTVFPVWLSLPIVGMAPDAALNEYLESIARACAESWIELLGNNVEAFLELSETARASVAELLQWTCGSESSLSARLRQAGSNKEAADRMLIRRLKEAFGDSHSVIHPTESQLRSWLSVRPPELKFTYLIAGCYDPGLKGEAQAYEERLARMIHLLLNMGVTLKLLTIVGDRVPNAFRLEWDKDALKTMLSARLSNASDGNKNRMNDLFFRAKPDEVGARFDADEATATFGADDIIAERSRGSPTRMLAICRAIIQARLERKERDDPKTYENDPFLNEEDLNRALEKVSNLP